MLAYPPFRHVDCFHLPNNILSFPQTTAFQAIHPLRPHSRLLRALQTQRPFFLHLSAFRLAAYHIFYLSFTGRGAVARFIWVIRTSSGAFTCCENAALLVFTSYHRHTKPLPHADCYGIKILLQSVTTLNPLTTTPEPPPYRDIGDQAIPASIRSRLVALGFPQHGGARAKHTRHYFAR